MPRQARPWWRRGCSMFYFTFKGVQYPTGISDPADVAGAQAAMERILAELVTTTQTGVYRRDPPQQPAPKSQPPADGRTLSGAVAEYLAHCERRCAAGKIQPGTLETYRRALGCLVDDLGSRQLVDLSAEDFELWADARTTWSPSTRHLYLGAVQAMLRHHRVSLPIKRPHKESRGDSCFLTDEQFAAVMADVSRWPGRNGDLGALLRVLRETGARPQEVARLTAADVDWANCCARLKKHKTKGKTGRDRVIHFPAAAMGVLRELRERHPTGLLFRTRHGGAYTRPVIVRRMTAVSERVGFRVIAYGLGRHSWATKALAAGIPEAIVAEALGQRGTGMLTFHYSHLGTQARTVAAAVEQVSQRKTG